MISFSAGSGARGLFVVVAFATAVANHRAAAQAVTFTSVASGSGVESMFGIPSINNSGTVAYVRWFPPSGTPPAQTRGVYITGIGGATTPAFETRESPISFGQVSINDAGAVSFVQYQSSPRRLYVVDAAGPRVIVDSDQPTSPVEALFEWPLIDSSGRVVYQAQLDDGRVGIFDGPDPVADRITDDAAPSGFPGLADVRRDGTVLFRGVTPQSRIAMYADHAGQQSHLFDFPEQFNNPHGYRENAPGQFVFNAFFKPDPSQTMFDRALFTGLDPTADRFVDTLGPFKDVVWSDINDAGTIAFTAELDAGGEGIFVGPDPVLHKVIMTGDPLFGSTVTDVHFHPGGLNDQNQLSFGYELANGVRGVAIAQVPEPGFLCVIGLGMVILRSRRRR